MKDNQAFKKIAEITHLYENSNKIYVASALQGITDILLNMAKNIGDESYIDTHISLIEKKHLDIIEELFSEDTFHYNECKDWLDKKMSELEDCIVDIQEFGREPYYIDYISSFGEILSTFILNQYLLSQGFESIFISANNLIITNDEFNNAYPLYEFTNARVKRQIMPLLENPKRNVIFCVTGFIGRNKIGYITTLGRGGSDYTATILARTIHDVGSDKDIKVILWKDVDGLLTIDPKYVEGSVLIKSLNYVEAKQIASIGAKVLHPKCLEAIENKNVPLEIRNFDNPAEKMNYTTISNITDKGQIKGISAIEDATIITVTSGSMVDVPGVLAKIFGVMGEHNISVSFVAQSSSEISTSFVVKGEEGKKALEALQAEKEFADFFKITWEEISIINITGKKVLDNITKAKIFNALEKQKVKVQSISQSNNGVNLSLIVSKDNIIKGIKEIHNELCEEFDTLKCNES